ncbi:MAG: hypothetical protein IKF14_11740 [Atopobiaceae bacterium]|nr:hypothetical protein [Atopobiaceae bacterium]
MASGQQSDPLSYSLGRRRGKPGATTPGKPALRSGRKPGRKAFMLYLPPDLHTAIQMRKAVTGEDMGEIMVWILTDAMVEELEVVRKMKKK